MIWRNSPESCRTYEEANLNRRHVLKTGLAAGLIGAAKINASAAAEGAHYYELRNYELRNDLKPNRLREYFQNHFLPALKRQEVGPVGCFTVASGALTASLLVMIDYKSLAEMQSAGERLLNDQEYVKAWQEFEGSGELPYVRYETTLLRAFDRHPKIEVPAPLTGKDGKPAARVFELRTYESRTTLSLKSKIEMFNQEEIKIFRDCNFAPVFFGETIVGTRMPSLTYMVGFDNMEEREKAWAKFVSSPDFNRIKVKPGWTDPEVVSNIRSAFLRPTPFSQIR
jgi:NIPSNAP